MPKKRFTVERGKFLQDGWLLCEHFPSGAPGIIAVFSCHDRAVQVCNLLNKEEKFVGSDEEESE